MLALLATAYPAAKRRSNDCSVSRSDSNNAGGRLGFSWCHFSSHWRDHLHSRSADGERRPARRALRHPGRRAPMIVVTSDARGMRRYEL